MIGIVVVSHSRALADAAVALASEMVDAGARPRIAVAAGLDATTFGTDAAAISEAITAVDSPDGVLVVMDLGSAILSAEMALEFLDPDDASRVRLTPAPFVEGLVAAVVTAAGGGSLDEVDAEARGGAAGKLAQLGCPVDSPAGDSAAAASETGGRSWRHTMTNPHGLHARPAAAFVGAFRGLDVSATLRNLTTASAPVDAASLTQIAILGIEHGHEIEASLNGPDAELAIARLDALAADAFGESTPAAVPAAVEAPDSAQSPTVLSTAGSPARVTGPAVVIDISAPADATGVLDLPAARQAVEDHLRSLAVGEPASAIIDAQIAMLRDPVLTRELAKRMDAGDSAASAVERTTATIENQFATAGSSYLRERAADVRSLRRLLLRALAGWDLALPRLTPGVLLLDELDAATAAQLSADVTPGVIAARHGDTGHGAIIARAKGIAVATGVSIAGMRSGQSVSVPATGA